MKALIVDDEPHVRDCINLLADWASCGIDRIFEAETVRQAMACVRAEEPELVITDIRMPESSGLALMEWLHREYPRTVVIVVSAFHEFEYAISAMRCGALDYLLKPIQPKQLNDLLKKAGAVLQAKEDRGDLSAPQLDINERIMLALFAEGDAPLPDHSQLQHLFTAPLGLLILDLFCLPAGADASPAGKKRFFDQICRRIEPEALGWAFQGVGRQCMTYLLLTGPEETQRMTAEEILALTEAYWGGPLLYGLYTDGIWNCSTLPVLVSQASETLLKQQLLECYLGGKPALPPSIGSFFASVEANRLDKAFAQAEQMVNALKSVRLLTRRDLKAWWDALCTHCEDFLTSQSAAEESHPAFLFQQSLPVLGDQLRLQPEVLLDYLKSQIQILSVNFGNPQTQHIDLPACIEQEIRTHYAEQISLSSIAAKFYRNPSYIARIFKERYQISVVNYITQVRIEQAKVLLKTTDYRIFRVAAMVGYTDEKYFSRVFKKTAGLSAVDFRNL